jgi:hypothetical protein
MRESTDTGAKTFEFWTGRNGIYKSVFNHISEPIYFLSQYKNTRIHGLDIYFRYEEKWYDIEEGDWIDLV